MGNKLTIPASRGEIEEWSSEVLVAELRKLGFAAFAACFEEHEIDGSTVLSLNERVRSALLIKSRLPEAFNASSHRRRRRRGI